MARKLNLSAKPLVEYCGWLNFVGLQFSGFFGGSDPRNLIPTEKRIFCINYEEKYFDHDFEHHECVMFAQTTKIGTHENKAIHSMCAMYLNLS